MDEAAIVTGWIWFVSLWMFISTNEANDAFEAAFQGQCQDLDTPCQHICVNHSPRTYECQCRDGFELAHNGYDCVSALSPQDVQNLTDLSQAEMPSVVGQASDSVLNRTGPLIPPCASVLCIAGGICAADHVHGYRCLCPLGRKGKHCEKHVSFTQPRFSGDSYAVLPLPTNWDHRFHLEMDLQADSESGLIFYSGQDLRASRNFVVVELVEGYIVFRMRLDGHKVAIQSRYKVPLRDLIHLQVGRQNTVFYVRVAAEVKIATTVQELASASLRATENIYLGGLADFDGLPVGMLASSSGFVGCILSLRVNEMSYQLTPLPFGNILSAINLDGCNADRCEDLECLNDGQCMVEDNRNPRCDCVVPYVGTHCEIDLDTQMPMFNGSSYLMYELVNSSVTTTTDFLITFKPDNVQSGILLRMGNSQNSWFQDGLELRLRNARVQLEVNFGDGSLLLELPRPVVTGKWYQVAVSRTSRYVEMALDERETAQAVYRGAFSELTLLRNVLYVGGIESRTESVRRPEQSILSFMGCIDLYKTEFMGVKLKLSKALTAVNLDPCRITIT